MKQQKDRYPLHVTEYSDERTDDFAGVARRTIRVDGNYRYLKKGWLYRLSEFFVYRVIMTPFAFLYCKLKFGYRVKGREKLRAAGKSGYFIYSNHTLMAGDAFLPSLVSFPRKTKAVVHPDNISVRAARGWIERSGAVPVPNRITGMRGFSEALEKYTLLGHAIQIYPEAHIWPYYTGIRPFGAESFYYPVRFSAPTYAATVTYHARKFRRTPRVEVFVDGPYFADPTLPERKQASALRDCVYSAMCERAGENDCEVIRYIKKESGTNRGEVS